MARKRIHPPRVPREECGAKLKNGKKCKEPPANPDSTRGNSRCAGHGGLSTGPVTPEGKEAIRVAGAVASTTHGLYASASTWDEYRRRKYGEEEQKLLDEVPTAPDLAPEIQALRMKMEMLERNRIQAVQRAEQHGAAPAGTPPEQFGLKYNKITGELVYNGLSISRWIELENQSRDTLRKIMQSQKEINPAGKARGNLTLSIEISGGVEDAAKEDDIPQLTAGDEEEESTPGSTTITVDAEVVERRKDDDLEE